MIFFTKNPNVKKFFESAAGGGGWQGKGEGARVNVLFFY